MRRELRGPGLLRLSLLSTAIATLGVAVAACSGGGGHRSIKLVRLGPDNAVESGGTPVYVIGSNFASPASVLFGDAPGTDVQVLDKNTILCNAPVHAAGVVDVTVHAGGGTDSKASSFKFLTGTESEPQNQNGLNDSFQTYELIPLEYDWKGYIGSQDDVDVLHVHTPFDGKVFITVDWQESYTSGGLAGLSVEYFHGPDPSPNPDAYFGGSVNALAVNGSARLNDWLRMSYYADGHGPFLRIRGIGDPLHPAGYDPVHPYTVHVHYVKDTSVEPGNSQDTFLFAQGITPGLGASAAAIAEQEHYDQDFDWYSFPGTADGWARVVVTAPTFDTSTSFQAVSVSATLFDVDPANPTRPLAINGASAIIGDRPSVSQAVFETPLVQTGHTYYLRLYNVDDATANPTFPFGWNVTVEGGNGSFEAQQPGTDLPAEVETSANDVSIAATGAGGAVQKTDYFFHAGDHDWFKVTPQAGTSVTVDLDDTGVRQTLGDYDALLNPLGMNFGVLAFDQTWFTTTGHTPSQSETIGGTAFDVASGANTHSVTFPVTAGQPYYVLVQGGPGFDETDPYTVTFTANP